MPLNIGRSGCLALFRDCVLLAQMGGLIALRRLN